MTEKKAKLLVRALVANGVDADIHELESDVCGIWLTGGDESVTRVQEVLDYAERYGPQTLADCKLLLQMDRLGVIALAMA